MLILCKAVILWLRLEYLNFREKLGLDVDEHVIRLSADVDSLSRQNEERKG